MPRRLPLTRRLATAARWPLGVTLTSWRYLWRTTPLYRSEEDGTWAEDAPPPLPDGVDWSEVQGVDTGAGPLFHRSYVAQIRGASVSPAQLVERVAADPDRVAPTEFATFKKVHGEEGDMAAGDEYVVRMPGPWDGPVRVIERTPSSFRLATLDGHLEAGQIAFSSGVVQGRLQFRIESWARSADWLSDVLYDRLRMSKEVQFHMWASFLEGVIELSGGERDGGLRVKTRRVDGEPDGAERPLRDPGALRALHALHEKPLNFDLSQRDGLTQAPGWRVDDYLQPLPSEAPGPPEPGGTWERARELMRRYEFADPRMIRAVYAPDSELEGRDMLLEARFWGLRFHFGVRVGGVVDARCERDGRRVRVWGWSYRTLQGHLEMGQMDYQLWKWLDTGRVEFRIHVVSRPARIPNPLIRLGFRLFGRHQQIRFARRACERMASLLSDQPVQPVADVVAVRTRA
jgi:uncharacterized protein (UPF0548 family)